MHAQHKRLDPDQTRTLHELRSDPVTALRVLPHGPTYRLDELRQHGKIQTRIYIGRSAHCDIQLNDDTVSAVHCVVFRERGRLYVEERRNKNRMYVNETPIWGGQIELFSGFVLRLGLTRVLVCGRAGDKQRAFILARGLDAFLHSAVDDIYGNQALAAEHLGIAPATLNRWYHEHRFELRALPAGADEGKE